MNDILNSIKDYFLSGGVELAKGITIILVCYMLIRMVISFLKKKVNKQKNIDRTLPNFIISIINIVLMAILIIYALVLLGASIDSVVTIASVFSLGISLALQDTMASLANGVIIIITKPFVEGEYVSFSKTDEGTVVSITMFNTTLKTFDGLMVTVPNSVINSEKITNFSRLPTRRIDLSIPVGYKTDIELLHQVIDNIVSNEKRIIDEPAPQFVLKKYGDSNLDYSLRVWVSTNDYWDTYFALNEAVLLALRENNISIDYTQYDVHIRNDDIDKIVKENKHA